MIDMKKAHSGARFITKTFGGNYHANLKGVMLAMWAEVKKAAMSVEDAIESLNAYELKEIVYGYLRNFEGYNSQAAEDLAMRRVCGGYGLKEALNHAGYGTNTAAVS